jgi:hypothetical protein
MLDFQSMFCCKPLMKEWSMVMCTAVLSEALS